MDKMRGGDQESQKREINGREREKRGMGDFPYEIVNGDNLGMRIKPE